MSAQPFLARPRQGTVRRCATCATCGEPIVQTYRDLDWMHQWTGDVICRGRQQSA